MGGPVGWLIAEAVSGGLAITEALDWSFDEAKSLNDGWKAEEATRNSLERQQREAKAKAINDYLKDDSPYITPFVIGQGKNTIQGGTNPNVQNSSADTKNFSQRGNNIIRNYSSMY